MVSNERVYNGKRRWLLSSSDELNTAAQCRGIRKVCIVGQESAHLDLGTNPALKLPVGLDYIAMIHNGRTVRLLCFYGMHPSGLRIYPDVSSPLEFYARAGLI